MEYQELEQFLSKYVHSLVGIVIEKGFPDREPLFRKKRNRFRKSLSSGFFNLSDLDDVEKNLVEKHDYLHSAYSVIYLEPYKKNRISWLLKDESRLSEPSELLLHLRTSEKIKVRELLEYLANHQPEKLSTFMSTGYDTWDFVEHLVRLSKLEQLVIENSDGASNPPSALFSCDSLKQLYLRRNQIEFISDDISKLSNLEVLDISGNKIKIVSAGICRLQSLRQLNLSTNEIAILPSELCNMRALSSLNISNNKISVLPMEVGNLHSLTNLNISNNEVKRLPDSIGSLSNLQKLDVSKNMLVELPTTIGDLKKLEILTVNDNELVELPVEIRNLWNLKTLSIRSTFITIPPEIASKSNDVGAILSYYFDGKIKGDKPINECKILVVGQGSVGKTSLVRKFASQNQFSLPLLINKTDGIEISVWSVENFPNEQDIDNEGKIEQSKININIWDFGGQEIMHATHQFFLTKRSLYLLVLDSRLTQEENRVEYWLKIIQSFGSDSPVLIVGNKIDQHPLDIDRTGLQKKYPNIVGIIETSAAKGTGIEELKIAIGNQVRKLPHVHDLLPQNWFEVKTQLEKLGQSENFINYEQYVALCVENRVVEAISQRTLIGFLHDLGIVIHFQDDPRLKMLGILNPHWVTNGVYKIINSHALFQNKGILTFELLNDILVSNNPTPTLSSIPPPTFTRPTLPPTRTIPSLMSSTIDEYPPSKRLFIVDMMRKFELCYDIEPDKTFLVPDLLPKDQPDLKFNGIPAFEYAYPVLPSSVITRFIVRMNQKIHDGLVWRTGVLLKIGENTALVKADIEDRKITIAIDGLEHTRRDALSAIRFQLDEIHGSIKGLGAEKKVPVPNAPKAESLKYEYLLKLERAGQETLLVENGNDLVTVNVRQMLSAIESETQRKEIGGSVTNIYVQGNVEGSNIVSGNNNVITQSIQNSFNKADTSDIQAELKDTLKQLADAVAVMTKSMPDEQAAEATDDLSKLVDEVTKPKPNKKWYSVSIEGLIAAAENVEKVGEPVINLSRKVLSLLTGGVIK